MPSRLTLQTLAESLIRESEAPFTLEEYVSRIQESWQRRIAPQTLNHLKAKLNNHDYLIEVGDNDFLPFRLILDRLGRIPLVLYPGKAEQEQGLLVPGHRMAPFVSCELEEGDLTFYDPAGREVPKQRKTFFIEDVIPYFQYCDERHFPDQIKVNQFVPGKSMLTVTAWHVRTLYREGGIQPGDALQARLEDYRNGVFSLHPYPAERVRQDRVRLRSLYIGLERVLCDLSQRKGQQPTRLDKQLLYALFTLTERRVEIPAFSFPELVESLGKMAVVRDDRQGIHLAPAHPMGPEPYQWEVVEQTPSGRTGSLGEIFEDMGLAFTDLEFKAILYSVMATDDFDIEAVFDLLFGAKRDTFYDDRQHKAFYRFLRKLLQGICEDLKCPEPKPVSDIRNQTVSIKLRLIEILRYLESQYVNLEDLPAEMLEVLADLDEFCTNTLEVLADRLEPPDVKSIRDMRMTLQMIAPDADLIEEDIYNNLGIY
ncbi:hypothetical protein [Nitrospina watsonii]|uniref:TerB-C domain-containing protein n=1 Tax=Nitrospina watsonii TaxID=1323948 RepID=A0ABM9HGU0_9BACT|nr:hypothetical protein [Nitrospina watsonii]CAI2719550.1 conserved protein of unknown function [Nitrospina watsonii]